MKNINLKDIYPDTYTTDFFCEVSDAVADAMEQDKRNIHAYNERRRVHHAYYSLDKLPESEMLLFVPSPETLYEQHNFMESLYAAIRRLPAKQAARIYARFFLGLSITDIARIEGIQKAAVKKSIDRALKRLKKYF